MSLPVRAVSHKATPILEWLDDPRPGRGIRTLASDGSWQFHPYSALAARIRRVAARLRGLGLAERRVVALVVTDPLSFLTAFTALMSAGMVPAPLAPPLTFRGSDRYIDHLAATFRVAMPAYVIADTTLAEYVVRGVEAADSAAPVLILSGEEDLDVPGNLDDAEPGPIPETGGDLALLQFTSGSTGTPKGVCVSHAALTTNVGAIASWLRLTANDSFAGWLPHYHDMGLIGTMITPLSSGLDIWLMKPEQFVRTPLRWLECLGRHGATVTMSPNFGYSYIAERVSPEQISGLDFGNWRVALTGAERIDAPALHRFHRLVGPRGFSSSALVGAYGLAESTLAVTGCEPGAGTRVVRNDDGGHGDGQVVRVHARAALGVDAAGSTGWLTSCGAPIPEAGVTVVDADGAALPPGRVGEIVVHGPSLANGYLTAAGFEPFSAEGFSTGDAGVVLDDELYVIGRIGDAIKIRGASAYAEDIEVGIRNLPGHGYVRCTVVLGVTLDGEHLAVLLIEDEPDAEWLTAAIACTSTLTAGLADVLVLRGPSGSVMRTSSGKPRRRLMWKQLVSDAPSAWDVVCGNVPASMKTALTVPGPTAERS
ncbi:AMP-binding protein [Nocardia sp. Marseille-Q1738]